MTSSVVDLASELIRRPSVTPEDGGCQRLIADRLGPLGFTPEFLRFGNVENLWLRRGESHPLLVFAGHTDVVPTGARDAWRYDPFAATIDNGMLYGRGAADMKSSLAAFVAAITDYLRDYEPKGSIALLLTSDEEGPAVDGTVKVMDWLKQQGVAIDYCVIGEPSSEHRFGDTIKHGRRGSLTGVLRVRGIGGHVAYPHLARNPIHQLAPALEDLVKTQWDQGTDDFPPTGFQVTRLATAHDAENVIPSSVEARFNFRFAPSVTAAELQQRVAGVLHQHGLDFQLEWTLGGQPFLTRRGVLIDTAQAAIRRVCGAAPKLSTGGGTSDGRFIAPSGAEVIEIGPVNRTIHKVDECIDLADLKHMVTVYYEIMKELLA